MTRTQGDRGPTKRPQCPTCLAAGRKPVKGPGWVKPDGRVKMVRVKRRGRSVTLPAAWVVCQRRSGHFGKDGPVCGWGWWSTVRAAVALALCAPVQMLLRRHQKPPGMPGRGGWGQRADHDD